MSTKRETFRAIYGSAYQICRYLNPMDYQVYWTIATLNNLIVQDKGTLERNTSELVIQLC